MQASSFHITLPSNVKNDYNNWSNSFRTTLPYQISLTGEWEVGLSEIFLPVSHYNVGNGSERDRQIGLFVRDGEVPGFVGVTVSAGNYPSITELTQEINREIQTVLKPPNSCTFYVDSITRRTLIVLTNTPTLSLVFLGAELAYILGFPENSAEIEFGESGKAVSPWSSDISANLTTVYLYTNIIQNQIVGNTQARLLRIVPINARNFGEISHKYFERPQFHELACNNFSEIEIELRTETGKLFPIKYGTVVVQLSFRRKGLRL